MRVTLDATAVPASPAGAGRYTIELAAALGASEDPELTVLTRRGDTERWNGYVGKRGRVVALAPEPRPLRLAWEQVGLPRALRRIGPDVHHGPHYTMPERSPVPVVVTVHDCTYFDHPEWHERSKVLLFRRAIRVAARRAAAIVCVSETTARHLASICVVAGPVVVAPHGVDHDRFRSDPPGPGADERALRQVGLDPKRPFVLFVGTVEPRKDVASLIRAFGALADDTRDVILVIAGRPGWGDGAVDTALVEVARHRARVVVTGYVPDDVLPPLLRSAAVVAYPSLAEGYGLPALEALACGAPLVTTLGTAMAEFAGGAAVLVPPKDPIALAGALADVLARPRDTPLTVTRRHDGLEIAASRTWEASAARHAEAYRLARGE